MSKRVSTRASRLDRKRPATKRDDGIDLSDQPEATPEMFANAVYRFNWQKPPPKEQVTLRLDADVIKWFRSTGVGYQTRMNLLLRAYMDAKRKK